MNIFPPISLATLIFLALPGLVHCSDEPPHSKYSDVILSFQEAPKPSREMIFGHNIDVVDWHGSTFKGVVRRPVIWDPSNGGPHSFWKDLTHRYPLHLVRFHTGNFYPWKDALGSKASRKPITHWSWDAQYGTEAGLEEFFSWLETLPGKPNASLIASPFRPPEELAELVAYCNSTNGPMADLRAANGHPLPHSVTCWELGNESDWTGRADLDITRPDSEQEAARKLTVTEYIKRCRPRIEAMRRADPHIKIYAHAATSPWYSSNPRWRTWHREILREMATEIDGIVIHPYYDGYPVPIVLKSIDDLIADIHELVPDGRPFEVWVNEHARWVKFQDRKLWPETWSLQGAISTADFLLRLMDRPEISMANYWCYIHRGPWRVLNADVESEPPQVVSTHVDEMFRILNAALLSEFQLMSVDQGNFDKNPEGYTYSVTAGLFSDAKTKKRTLVAINRSPDEGFCLVLPKSLAQEPDLKVAQTILTGHSLSSATTSESQAAVVVQESSVSLSRTQAGESTLDLPPRSIASWSWEDFAEED